MHFARQRRGERILIFWKIAIPAGQPFPYVSQEMPVNELHPCLNGEYEVLLPTNLVLSLDHFTKLRFGEPDYVALAGTRPSRLPIYVYSLRVVGYERTDTRFWERFRARSLQTLDKIKRYENGEDVSTGRPVHNEHADEDAGVIFFSENGDDTSDAGPRGNRRRRNGTPQIVNAANLSHVSRLVSRAISSRRSTRRWRRRWSPATSPPRRSGSRRTPRRGRTRATP
jgi:hypothetical protein